MKRTTILLAMALILIILLSGCAECISTEYEDIEVVIVDTYHQPYYITSTYIGGKLSFTHHPSVYRTYIECKYGEFTLSDSDTYYTFRDKIGETAVGVLETKTYDDGDVFRRITSIREK